MSETREIKAIIQKINTETAAVGFAGIPANQPKKNGSVLRYAAKLITLGAAICKNAPENAVANEYEKTREFECLVRDELVTPEFVDPGDAAAVSKVISYCDGRTFAREMEGAISREPEKTYLQFALGILLGASAEDVNKLYDTCCRGIIGTDREADENWLQCVRYVAFYALSTYLRRNKYKKELKALHEEYMGIFKEDFPSAEHIRLESIAGGDLTERNVSDAWKLCSETMPAQCGVQMMYANMVSQFCEKDTGWPETKSGKSHLQQARDAIDEAIRTEIRYPKAYVIKARLFMWLGNYEEALKEVKQGIELQKRGHKNDSDYIERLVDFYDTQFTVEIKQQECELQKKSDALEEELKSRDIKSLEILGLFTAVIGIMVGVLGGGAAGNLTSILMLFGATIVTFTVFHFLINARPGKTKELLGTCWIPAVIGLIMIVVCA